MTISLQCMLPGEILFLELMEAKVSFHFIQFYLQYAEGALLETADAERSLRRSLQRQEVTGQSQEVSCLKYMSHEHILKEYSFLLSKTFWKHFCCDQHLTLVNILFQPE